jgi:hypothetical protein
MNNVIQENAASFVEAAEKVEEEKAIEATGTEAVEEQPQKTEEPEDKFSSRFAAMAKREREFLEKQEAWKKERDERDAHYKSQEEKYSKYESFQDKLNNDPLSTMAEYGWDYGKLTDKALGLAQEEADYDPRKEIEALRNELKRRDTEAADKAAAAAKEEEDRRVQQENDKTLDSYRVQVREVVGDAAKYELISAHDATEDVLTLAIEYYKKYQEILAPEKAADMVEAELEAQARKFLALTKFKNQDSKESQSEKESLGYKAPTPSKTLSNENTAGNNPLASESRYMTDEEQSKRRSASMLKWD